MVKVAIVYHSRYGHTEKQAQSVEKGVASVEGVEAKLFKATELTSDPTQLNDYDAIIFGSATYMGSASSELKAFMEASSRLWAKQEWKDKIAAGFTNSLSLSGDKLNTLMQISIFAMQHGMIWVGVGDLNQSPDGQSGKPDAINRTGTFLGAIAQSDNASPEVTPPSGDLKTAELLGKRVAEITKKFKK
jgi:multimeric flavodoxin WrbA